MTSSEVRQRYLDFFEKRGHAVIPSASLVPENDPTVLFNTAGMQPLIPFLMGEDHPKGKRLTNVQKCVRTQDIDEVGDNTHDTFFEMLGNWSLGDYFKEEQLKMCYEFLTSEEGLGLDKNRIYVTVFAGNDDAPIDTESREHWISIGVPEHRIFDLEDNWWSVGDDGPCGPDSEIFYDMEGSFGDITKEEFLEAEEEQKIVEIGNSVFLEYEKKDGKVIGKLPQQNVDFGGGFERQVMAVQGKTNIFETDLFAPMMEKIDSITKVDDTRAKRIVADHIRTSVFMISDGVAPSNTDRGYILRRLMRRAIRYGNKLEMNKGAISGLVEVVIDKYKDVYGNLSDKRDHITGVFNAEAEKFEKTLEKGLKEFEKLSDSNISGEDAFMLFSTYGFPIESTIELAKENKVGVDVVGFKKAMGKHQDESRLGSEQKFKGGLADTSEMSVKYHTATHLLHQALRDVLGDHVEQKGSNITPDRLRFDFSHDEKMTDEEKEKVTEIVNAEIKKGLPVSYEDMTVEEAKERGAIGVFEDKYGDSIRVYSMGEGKSKFSFEICGGPHVTNTNELGTFRIKKEEASSQGVRRIKAVLE